MAKAKDDSEPLFETEDDSSPSGGHATAVADEPDPKEAPTDEGSAPEPEPPPETPPADPEPPGLRDMASQYGLDLSNYEDDESALKYLAERAQRAEQLNELAQYGQQYVQHAADFQEFLRQRQAQQAQPEEEKPLLWKSEWNPAWESMLTTDEQGNIVPNTAKGGTPELVQKYYQHQQHQLDVLRRLAVDPESTLDPYVQARAEAIARKVVEEKLGEFGANMDARHFVLANRDWMYELKEDGTRQFTDEGKFFKDKLEAFEKDEDLSGIPHKAKEKLAMQALQEYRKQKQHIKPSAEDNKKRQLESAAGFKPSAAASTNRPPDASGAAPQDENLSIEQQLMAAFQAEGHDPRDELVEA